MPPTTTPAEAPINDPSLFVGPKLATCKRSGWTRDEFFATFGEDDPKLEILDGRLFVAASPFRPHQRALLALAKRLSDFVEAGQLGEVVLESDLVLGEDNVVVPDLIFLGATHPDLDVVDGRISHPPELVVEVLSASTRRHDLNRKFAAYERFGVLNYWLVDTDKREVLAFTLDNGVYQEVAMPSGILKAPPLGDFECKLEEIFRKA